jgi:hypothetical protein
VDRHLFDADLDTTHFDGGSDPDSNPDPTSSYTVVGKKWTVVVLIRIYLIN